MKKLMIYISVILLVIVVAVGYHFSFPVKDDCSNLETYIDEWLNRGRGDAYSHNITLYDPVTFGNLTYIPMEVDEEIGYVLLKRSITGRYKISHSAHGSGSFRNGIVKIGDQKYLLLMGRNTFGKITKVKFTIDVNHEYEIDVPKQKVFLEYTEVDNDVQIEPVILDKITLYNAEGREVTSEFDLSGGSIQ
jgi:hypothetical protein